MFASYAASVVVASHLNRVHKSISGNKDYERHALMNRLILMNDRDCRDQLRMGREAFARLVKLLRDTGRLYDSVFSNVEEKVAKFLYLIGQDARNRNVKFLFYRSGETVSRHFHEVLRAIISLHDIFLRQPNGLECPPEIMNNTKFWPYFKDCIGALDGSHFRVKVGNDIVQRYRGRKAFSTQNVLAACSFDLKFTYVLPGWEGSASDSRILDNALTRDLDKLIVPQGKYYLVDAGYQLRSGFLAPYRSTRYHLKEYSLRQPKNARELFNLRHASLRNAIERVFGILKKRFPILGSGAEPYYHVDTQANIVVAECILHNYLMGIDPNEELIAEVDEELMREPISSDVAISSQTQQCREGEILRERIATTFWRDYNTNND
ncbi:hypothetical protein UlMin_009056 [Ulmus minor]